VPIGGMKARHELVEIGGAPRVGFESEVLVGAQIVDPEFLRPGRGTGRFSVEQEDVRLHTLGLEDPSRQPQQGLVLDLGVCVLRVFVDTRRAMIGCPPCSAVLEFRRPTVATAFGRNVAYQPPGRRFR
jgi:hypothetical protein